MGALAAQEAALLSRYSLTAESMQQWRLPERLNEISGLALDADERLFAVADEEAVIYRLDVAAGRLQKVFAFGSPPIRGDFEGIAILAGTFYLVTSDGDIYSGAEAADGEYVEAMRHVTGLGAACEIEGLTADPLRNRLLLVCKEGRGKNSRRKVAIHAWDIADSKLLPAATVQLPVRDIARAINANRVSPSGITLDPATGHLLLVAARQHALIELLPDGRLLQALRLPLASRHRQPEGIERLRDGRLLIADEGGSHKARLAVYAADRGQRP